LTGKMPRGAIRQ